jgi:hypothetical protein
MVGEFEDEEDEGVDLKKRHLNELHKRRTNLELGNLLVSELLKLKD